MFMWRNHIKWHTSSTNREGLSKWFMCSSPGNSGWQLSVVVMFARLAVVYASAEWWRGRFVFAAQTEVLMMIHWAKSAPHLECKHWSAFRRCKQYTHTKPYLGEEKRFDFIKYWHVAIEAPPSAASLTPPLLLAALTPVYNVQYLVFNPHI